MSHETPDFNPLTVKAWTALSIVLSLFFFSLFLFGDHLLHAGNVAWDLLRYLARPII